MAGKRDLVRFESTERVDKPDFEATQRNSRSDTRASFAAFLFGDATTDRVLGGWQMTPNAPPDALVNIAAGRMAASEQLDDASFERGVIYGLESTAPVALDFTGAPVAVYNVYIHFVQDPGQPGNRVFWDQDLLSEAVASINTREVARWSATFALVSPGTDWIKIGEVDWDGAAVVVTDIAHDRFMFFEGNENTVFLPEWGDSTGIYPSGTADRSADRGPNGVGSLYAWVQAVRRQLADIIGGGQWFAVPPRDLTDLNQHLADIIDPHGVLLTQTNLDVTALLQVLGTLEVDTINSNSGGGITINDDVNLGPNEVNATKFHPTTGSGVLGVGDENRLFTNTLIACSATVTDLTVAAPTLSAGSHNISTFTRTGVGSYELVFMRPLPPECAPIAQVIDTSGTLWLVGIAPVIIFGAVGLNISTARSLGGGFVADDPPRLSIIVIHG